MPAALALASSRAVIQRCRSTSQLAFRWYVCAPPLEITKLQASSTLIVAVAKLIVPRHVWPISAWVLIIKECLIRHFGKNFIKQKKQHVYLATTVAICFKALLEFNTGKSTVLSRFIVPYAQFTVNCINEHMHPGLNNCISMCNQYILWWDFTPELRVVYR